MGFSASLYVGIYYYSIPSGLIQSMKVYFQFTPVTSEQKKFIVNQSNNQEGIFANLPTNEVQEYKLVSSANLTGP